MRLYLLAREGSDSVQKKRGLTEGWYWMEFEARKRWEHLSTNLPPHGEDGVYIGIACYKGMGRDSELYPAHEIVQRNLASAPDPVDTAAYKRGLRWWRVRHPISNAPPGTVLDADELCAFLAGRAAALDRSWEEGISESRLVRFLRTVQPLTGDRLRQAIKAADESGDESLPDRRSLGAFLRGLAGQRKCPWEKVAEEVSRESMRFVRRVVENFKDVLKPFAPEDAQLVARVEREMPEARRGRARHPQHKGPSRLGYGTRSDEQERTS